MPIQEDAFPHRDYDLPDGLERHIEAAPQSAYTDPAVLAAEQRAVFENDWVVVGRTGLIPEPGDYFCAMLGKRDSNSRSCESCVAGDCWENRVILRMKLGHHGIRFFQRTNIRRVFCSFV